MTATAAPVAGAVETATVSHLHPTPSWDIADHEVPTGTEEVWRFSPVRRLAVLLKEPSGEQLAWDAELPAGVTTRRVSATEARELAVEAPIDRVSALAGNTGGAAVVSVPAGAEISEPIVVTLTGESLEPVHGHTVFEIGANAHATIVLRHRGAATYGSKVDVRVGDGAKVNFVSLQDWEDGAIHGGQHSVLVGRDAEVRTVTVSLGGDIVRLVENSRFAAPGGSLEQFGLYFVDAAQHIEHRLFVDHNQPRTYSDVDYRGALQGDGARSVWIGDVLIRKIAEGISTYEANKNLVLTDGCRADSVPNLEIETGEIQGAGHSSTTGRFDDEQLFYLRSRGLTDEEARRLVVRGFFADIIRRIGVAEVEERLLAAIERELEVTMGVAQ